MHVLLKKKKEKKSVTSKLEEICAVNWFICECFVYIILFCHIHVFTFSVHLQKKKTIVIILGCNVLLQ